MLVYDKYKGFSCTNDESIVSEVSKESVFSNGFDQLSWSGVTGDDDEEDEEEDDEDEEELTDKKKRLTKSEKREQRQMKKINASRNRKAKFQQELNGSGGKHSKGKSQQGKKQQQSSAIPFNYNPYIAKAKIRSLHTKIHDLAQKTKREEFKLFQYYSIALYKSDIDHILPGEWINDNDISLIYEVINQLFINHKRNGHGDGNDPFNGQVQLLYPSLIQLFLHYPISEDIENILPIEDLKRSKFIFIPINFIEDYDEVDLEEVNNGDHWCLSLLSIVEHKLYIYDSMCIDEAMENDDKILAQLSLRLKSCKSIINSSKPVEIVRMKCDQQDNFDDCGVYLIMITCILIKRLLFPSEDSEEKSSTHDDDEDDEVNDNDEIDDELYFKKDKSKNHNDYNNDKPKHINLDISNIKFNVLGGRLFIMDLIYNLYTKLKT
ncbi:hypothetical protein DFJ63DRAFT_315813 [Scheffersomyces coipomensis]|uniref:uncharacterized protein n=1 Tax=Scheffersomyces coipomensis TaxID=1788519 RepID=UPI00315DBC3B